MGSMETPGGRARFFQNVNQPAPSGLNQNAALRSHERSRGHPYGGRSVAEFTFSASQRNMRTPQVDTDPAQEIADDRLPVAKVEAELLRMLELSGIVILVADTGAGKSTLVPQMLNKAGYKQVTGLLPRRVAVTSIGAWIAQQQGEELGGKVGFRHALEQCVGSCSEIVLETDGYHLAREMTTPTGKEEVLILDEVHEFNKYTEALLALMKYRREKPDGVVPKLIIMSATMDAEKISDFFGGNIPILNVPGRTFPVEEVEPGGSIAADVASAVRAGKNILVFLPGKNEIREMEMQIREVLQGNAEIAEVIPLHSQLSRHEQERAFRSYRIPKVVLATNVAQTSITIDDIDVVIASGLVRSSGVEDSVEILRINSISQFDYVQQKGRAGRTHDGLFINHGLPFDELQLESPPEIQNSKLESLFLRLLSGSEFKCKDDLERLQFLHPIPKDLFDDTFTALHQLGLVGPRGHITDLGREVAALPVDVRTGKMLASAREISRQDPEILLHAIDVAAVMETQGVTMPRMKRRWIKFSAGEHESDLLAQVAVFRKALTLEPDRIQKFGIDPVGVRRAVEMRMMLRRRLAVSDELQEPGPIDERQREPLLEAISVGMIDSLYTFAGDSGRGEAMYKPVGGRGIRRLSRDSILDNNAAVVGTPFDIAVFGKEGGQEILQLLLMASQVKTEWMRRHRPAIQKRAVDEAVKGIKRSAQGERTGRKEYRNNAGPAGGFR